MKIISIAAIFLAIYLGYCFAASIKPNETQECKKKNGSSDYSPKDTVVKAQLAPARKLMMMLYQTKNGSQLGTNQKYVNESDDFDIDVYWPPAACPGGCVKVLATNVLLFPSLMTLYLMHV